MSVKPDDISQSAWDAAIASWGRGRGIDDLARAIMDAEKRGEEREREACAFLAEHRHNVWGTRNQIEGIEVEDDRSACAEIATAILKRGEA